MIPLPNILGISAAIAIVSAAGGYTYGYSSATDKYAPEIANLKASIKSADEQAKIQQVKNKEALDENRIVAKDLAGRIAAYADERNANGSVVGGAINGAAHGDFYLQLAKADKNVPWWATFVKDQGYVGFPVNFAPKV